MKAIELRALAKCGAAEYFGMAKGRLPTWIAKLTYGDDPGMSVYQALSELGLVALIDGGRRRLTGPGWQMLNAYKPKDET